MIFLKKKNKAFTLIELMITIAIVGILSAIALPAYQDYTIRSQIAEGFNLISGPKFFVVDYYTNKGSLPQLNSDLNLPDTKGSYVDSIKLIAGELVIEFSSQAPHKANEIINGEKLIFKPQESASGNIMWSCSSSMPAKYLPTSCN